MDITTTATTNTTTTLINTNTIAASTSIKTPEAAENENPTRIQIVKPLSFSNGVLKRHQPLHHHRRNHQQLSLHAVVVNYKECLKNHAASLGGHAVDGCGEFMPSPATNPADPTSLKCAACGCHRNFHRREPEEPLPPPVNKTPALEYQPHHRHHPPPPTGDHSSPSSPSPPPISSSYYPSAPHMLLALSSGMSGPPTDNNTPMSAAANTSSGRKRFRTKFTQDQKEKMLEFAEKVGWKIQRRDDELINGFCNEVGVERGVLKVWMHNNKNTLGKKDHSTTNVNNGSGIGFDAATAAAATTDNVYRHHDDSNNSENVGANTNGSSSST